MNGAFLRLVCFPCAGGGASLFRGWPQRLSPDVELVAMQFPGRENRRHEPPLTRFEDLIDDLTRTLDPLLDRPYAFFGHSMGALVAYEIARRAEQDGKTGPVHLFVSAANPPGTGALPTDAPASELADHVDRYFGGLPPEVRADPAHVDTPDWT